MSHYCHQELRRKSKSQCHRDGSQHGTVHYHIKYQNSCHAVCKIECELDVARHLSPPHRPKDETKGCAPVCHFEIRGTDEIRRNPYINKELIDDSEKVVDE
jgi:hypothetical protein